VFVIVIYEYAIEHNLKGTAVILQCDLMTQGQIDQ